MFMYFKGDIYFLKNSQCKRVKWRPKYTKKFSEILIDHNNHSIQTLLILFHSFIKSII